MWLYPNRKRVKIPINPYGILRGWGGSEWNMGSTRKMNTIGNNNGKITKPPRMNIAYIEIHRVNSL